MRAKVMHSAISPVSNASDFCNYLLNMNRAGVPTKPFRFRQYVKQ